jgi:hypothetical protein
MVQRENSSRDMAQRENSSRDMARRDMAQRENSSRDMARRENQVKRRLPLTAAGGGDCILTSAAPADREGVWISATGGLGDNFS